MPRGESGPDEPYAGDAEPDESHLRERLRRRRAPLQARYEVRDRHVDHSRRRDGEDLGNPFAHARDREIGDERSHHDLRPAD